MASIQRYSVRGRTYWRVVESRRVNGKPRAIPILHLGSSEALIKRLTSSPALDEVAVQSFEHGHIAALCEIARELDFVAIVNRHIDKKYRGVSAGDALLLMAINRLIDPCSKNAWTDWAAKTSLFKFFPHVPLKKLSSQFFWAHMQQFSLEALESVEEELVQASIKHADLKLDLLFFDTTNCYTYVFDDDDESKLFQYGHSKEGQTQRLLFGVELLVARQGMIPLMHRTYPGNTNDSQLFPAAVAELCQRLRNLELDPAAVTLVFDRGNFSQANFRKLDELELGFVSALRLGDIPRDMFDIPLQKFRGIKHGKHKDLMFYTQQTGLWGKQRTLVFYISATARDYQIKLLNLQIDRHLKELHQWNAAIINQSGKSDQELDPIAVKNKIAALLKGPYLSQILTISYNHKLPRHQRLQFSINEKAKADIIQKYFGKRCLVTNRSTWTPAQIIEAYFNQATVERAFRLAKDRHHISLRPQFHWTDQSLRVHVFSCFIALLFGQLLLRKAQQVDPTWVSTPSLIETLGTVRLAALLTTSKTSQKTECVWKIEKNHADAAGLLEKLIKNTL